MALFNKKKNFRYFDLILGFFTVILLVSNISATKLIDIGPFIMDGGAVLFPLTYIFGDILTEVYGYSYARRAIWAGFVTQALAVLTFLIVQNLPPSVAYEQQAAFEAVLGFLPRIIIASLAAYLIGGFINAYVLARLKVKLEGKQLWLRFISSTFVGQFFDTLIFGLIAFGGMLTFPEMVNFILVGWIFKTLVEVVMLPLTYQVVLWLKTVEKSDVYDKKTDFSPLHVAVED